MRTAQARLSLKLAMLLNVVLLTLILLDFFLWDQVAAWPLVVMYAILLVAIVILLAAPGTAPYERIETVDEAAGTVIYPRNHG